MCDEPSAIRRADEIIQGRLGDPEDPHTTWSIAISAARIRHMVGARRMRTQLIAPDLFADPAWDILLEAFAGHLEDARSSFSALSAASGAPQSTASRWIATLVSHGLIVSAPHSAESSERYYLTPHGYLAMRNYFETVGLPI